MIIGMCGMQWSQTQVASTLSSFMINDQEEEERQAVII